MLRVALSGLAILTVTAAVALPDSEPSDRQQATMSFSAEQQLMLDDGVTLAEYQRSVRNYASCAAGHGLEVRGIRFDEETGFLVHNDVFLGYDSETAENNSALLADCFESEALGVATAWFREVQELSPAERMKGR